MKIAKPLFRMVEAFEKLPGIGPKTAQRLAYYLLHVPQIELDNFAEALVRLKKDTVLCKQCRNVSENDPCEICNDASRDKSLIMVVEHPLEVIAFEKTGKYHGLYHVLHGRISPLENIGPDEIFIKELVERIRHSQKNGGELKEVIIATNPTMEGEATAMYLAKTIKNQSDGVKITRLGMGIPTGADLEYADEVTLSQAIEGRKPL